MTDRHTDKQTAPAETDRGSERQRQKERENQIKSLSSDWKRKQTCPPWRRGNGCSVSSGPPLVHSYRSVPPQRGPRYRFLWIRFLRKEVGDIYCALFSYFFLCNLINILKRNNEVLFSIHPCLDMRNRFNSPLIRYAEGSVLQFILV